MTDILEQLKYQTEDNPLPKNLGRKTRNKIIIFKFRYLIYLLTIGLTINLFFLSAHFYHYLIDSEAIAVIRVLIEDFELSFDYILNSLASLKEILPLRTSLFLALNTFALVGFAEFFRRYRQELFNSHK